MEFCGGWREIVSGVLLKNRSEIRLDGEDKT